MDLSGIDLIGTIIAALLTVMVLSYLIGDNPLFRLSTYLFTGIAAGYAGTIAWHNILKPSLVDPLLAEGLPGILDGSLFSGVQGIWIIGAWVLIAMLLLKLSPSASRWGSLPMVILVGVGAGVVVGGAITGTLIPQSLSAVYSLNPSAVSTQTGETGIERMVNVTIMLVGTTCSLLYFQFTTRKSPTGIGSRPWILEHLATVGRVFIAITFGTMYAGALSATLIVLSERMDFLVKLIAEFLSAL
ncbi:MAG: hypothetical protein A2Z14_08035 [Chloroflexi bacterium RBG_16_48_8]|nr:MAG: hypothetical protein A2Z14_08035 [Chloroflexi bacterium RBG_16_48_8]